MLLTVTADRDSVCAGDDVVSHEATFTVASSSNVLEMLAMAWQVCPLAGIAGGQATWLIDVAGHASPIGVMAQQWDLPQLLIPLETRAGDLFKGAEKPAVYFRYWCRSDPDSVLEAIRTNAPMPARYS